MNPMWADALDAYEGVVVVRLSLRGTGPDRAEFRDRAASHGPPPRTDDLGQESARGRQEDDDREAWSQSAEHALFHQNDAQEADAWRDSRGATRLPLTLSVLLPVPHDLATLPDDAPPGWPSNYSPAELWMAEHWGTDGDLRRCDAPTDDGLELRYEFLAHGGVPEPWLAAVAVAFPDLECTLEYVFVEYGDAGRVTYCGSQLLERLHASDVEAVAAFARRQFGIELSLGHDGAT